MRVSERLAIKWINQNNRNLSIADIGWFFDEDTNTKEELLVIKIIFIGYGFLVSYITKPNPDYYGT